MIHIFLHNKTEWHIRFAGSPDKVWGIYLGFYTTLLSAQYLNDYWHHYHSCIHKTCRGLPVTFYRVWSCSFTVWKKIETEEKEFKLLLAQQWVPGTPGPGERIDNGSMKIHVCLWCTRHFSWHWIRSVGPLDRMQCQLNCYVLLMSVTE